MDRPINNKAHYAEQCVLGCILIDDRTISIARDVLKPNDFYLNYHKQIFVAMCNIDDLKKPINLATLLPYVSDTPEYNEFGCVDYFTSITNELPSASNIHAYIDVIKTESKKRQLILFSDGIRQMSANHIDNIDDEISRLSDELLSLSSDNLLTPWVDFKTALQKTCSELLNHDTDNVISSGFIDFDKMISGFRPGALYIIAARPAMGKTALGLNILANVGLKLNIPVAFFSLEMTTEELVNRVLSNISSINLSAIKQKVMSDDEWQRLLASAEKYINAQIYIDETPALDIAILRERARRMQKQYKIRMLVVDYLQLMRSCSKRALNREQEIADISRGLKGLAKDLKIPVVALAQLNRCVDARADKTPVLSDLRESGSIEQDADAVIFIHREDWYKPGCEPTNQADIIIAKQRSGPTGTIKLHWDGKFTRFSNLEENF